jgi:hypothetical protein
MQRTESKTTLKSKRNEEARSNPRLTGETEDDDSRRSSCKSNADNRFAEMYLPNDKLSRHLLSNVTESCNERCNTIRFLKIGREAQILRKCNIFPL